MYDFLLHNHLLKSLAIALGGGLEKAEEKKGGQFGIGK